MAKRIYGDLRDVVVSLHYSQEGKSEPDRQMRVDFHLADCTSTMEWTPPPGGIAMCQDGTKRLSTI